MLTLRFSFAALGLSTALMMACSGTATSPGDGLGTTQGTTDPPAATGTSPAQPTPAPATPTPAPTATGTGTSPVTPPPPPGACNAIVNDAASIGAQTVAADAPAPVGGAVVDGKYHLTNVSLFTGASGSSGPLPLSIQETIQIHGGTVDVVEDANGKSTRLTQTFTLAGNTVTFAASCPSSVTPRTGHYSAVGTTFTLFLANDAGQTATYTYSP